MPHTKRPFAFFHKQRDSFGAETVPSTDFLLSAKTGLSGMKFDSVICNKGIAAPTLARFRQERKAPSKFARNTPNDIPNWFMVPYAVRSATGVISMMYRGITVV